MPRHKKALKILILLIVIAAVVIESVLIIGSKAAGKGSTIGGGKARPVEYNNALNPAPGTQIFSMTIQDGKLVSGPTTIHSVFRGAFKLNITVHTTSPEYEFFVNHYTSTAEIDYPAENQKDTLTGQVYIYTDTRGTFKYGVKDESTGKQFTLGTLIVE